MKISLNTEELRKFIQRSDFVALESEAMNPTLSKYIQLIVDTGECTIIKANLSGYCVHEFSSDTIDDLKIPIDFLLLREIVSKTKYPKIRIEVSGNKILLTDDYFKLKFNTNGVDLDFFPKIPRVPELTRINLDIINNIKIAKNFLAKDPLRPSMNCVHLKDNIMYSTDMQSAFVKFLSSENSLSFSFTKSECSIISTYNYIDYGVSEDRNFNIFKFESTVYGLRIIDGSNPYDYNVFTNGVDREKSCVIKSVDFVNFCESTIGINANREYCTSSFALSDKVAELKFIDQIVDSENKINSNTESEEKFDFLFEPKRVLPILKSISGDEIMIADETGNRISLSNPNDKTYFFIVMRILF